MSTKDWKNGELKSLLTEAWGFKMDLNKLNEDFADKHRAAGNTLDEEEGLEEQDRAGLKSKASAAFDELDTQPAPEPVATKPPPAPKPEPVATTPSPAPTKTQTYQYGDITPEDREVAADLEKSFNLEESLDEMCGPEHDEAEVVIMGDEEGVVGDEAADPAERVAALMDELKDLLMQLAGGGDMEEAPMDEKRARGRRDARHVVGREDDDRKRPGDMSESRKRSLRENELPDPEMEELAQERARLALNPEPGKSSMTREQMVKTQKEGAEIAQSPGGRRQGERMQAIMTRALELYDASGPAVREQKLRAMVRKAIREAMK